MADTEKKTTTKKTTTTTKAKKPAEATKETKVETTNVDLSALLVEIESLKSQLANAQTQTIEPKEEKLDGDELIPVASHCVGTLCLTTGGYSGGTSYTFRELGEIQDIPFGDLRDIVRNNRNFAENGVFYIINEKAVKQLRLTEPYKKLLTHEDIVDLFHKDQNTIVEIYKMSSKVQKDMIVDMVCDKIAKGENIDMGLCAIIGQLCGKNLLEISK